MKWLLDKTYKISILLVFAFGLGFLFGGFILIPLEAIYVAIWGS